jgi:hypothetical protein
MPSSSSVNPADSSPFDPFEDIPTYNSPKIKSDKLKKKNETTAKQTEKKKSSKTMKKDVLVIIPEFLK